MSNPVLITGIGGPAGKSASQYFSGKGVFVIGTDIREVEDKAGRFYIVLPALDAGYEAAILDIIRRDRPTLFLPTVTEELPKAARMKGAVEALGAAVFISPPWAVDIANDKERTASFLSSRGVAVPRTLPGSTPRKRAVEVLGLPLLSKPVFGRGGRGVAVLQTEAEVLAESRTEIVFQEFIPGEEYDVNLFVAPGGRVEAAVALRKTAMKEGIVGNAAAVERAVRTDAVEISVRAALELALEGPIDMDVRLRADGTPVILEVNARLGGNSLSAPEVLDNLYTQWKKESGRCV